MKCDTRITKMFYVEEHILLFRYSEQKMFSYHFFYSCHWNNGFKRTKECGDKSTATQHDTVYQTTEETNTSSAILMAWYHYIQRLI